MAAFWKNRTSAKVYANFNLRVNTNYQCAEVLKLLPALVIVQLTFIFMVTEVVGLNLLGRDAIKALDIIINEFFFFSSKAISLADVDRDLQSVVRNCVMTMRICSNRSWVVYETWSCKSIQIRIQTNLHEIPPWSVCHTR